MGIGDTYGQLNGKMMPPDSADLVAIWKTICTDEEAETALMLPADAITLNQARPEEHIPKK